MRQKAEGGSSIVVFVAALPLLLVFLFAVVDLGRTVFLRMALDDAAHAALRAAVESPVGEASEALLERAALAASPGLENGALRFEASARYGEQEDATYVHRWHDGSTGAFEERIVHASRQPVEVECSIAGAYITPLGPMLSLAEGREGSMFVYRAQAHGICDGMLEGDSR